MKSPPLIYVREGEKTELCIKSDEYYIIVPLEPLKALKLASEMSRMALLRLENTERDKTR